MKAPLFIFTLIIASFSLYTAYNDCHRVSCSGNVARFMFRLMINGEDAVFGPNATIHRDSIRAYFLTTPEIERSLSISDTFQFLSSLLGTAPLLLEINNIRNDTFTFTSEWLGMGECCPIYEVNAILRNGQVICTGTCEEIIEIEI